MKSCPVCKARCFDDMEICYGCMHRFDEGASRDDALGEKACAGMDAQEPFASLSFKAAKKGVEPVPSEAVADKGGAMPSPAMPDTAPDVMPSLAAPSGDAAAPLRLELAVGMLASASLGNGYRLVLSIDRE